MQGFLERYVTREQLERDQTVDRLQYKSIPLTARVKRSKGQQGKANRKKTLTSRQKKELDVFKIDPSEQRLLHTFYECKHFEKYGNGNVV